MAKVSRATAASRRPLRSGAAAVGAAAGAGGAAARAVAFFAAAGRDEAQIPKVEGFILQELRAAAVRRGVRVQ